MKEKNKYAVALGRLGGQRIKEKYGNDYFKEMSKKAIARKKVLSAVSVEELENPITLQSVIEKLEQIDGE